MTSQDSTKCQISPSNPPMNLNGFKGIVRAGRRETARSDKHPRKGDLVEPMKGSSHRPRPAFMRRDLTHSAQCTCLGNRCKTRFSPLTNRIERETGFRMFNRNCCVESFTAVYMPATPDRQRLILRGLTSRLWGDIRESEALREALADSRRNHNPGFHDVRPRPCRSAG